MSNTENIALKSHWVEKSAVIGKALNRTSAAQIEHWIKIGLAMEDNRDLPYEFVDKAIQGKSEKEADELEEYCFN